MSKPIKILVTRQIEGWPKGAELGFATTALADKHLGKGNYEIVSYQDGSPYGDPVEDAAKPKILKAMTRTELEAFGLNIGFPDATAFEGNKDQLREAITAFQDGGPAEAPAEPESAPDETEG